MAPESIAYRKSLEFAKRIVQLCRHLRTNHQEYVLSKQILRSGTSIGANIAEARYGFSHKDFIAKIYNCAEGVLRDALLAGTSVFHRISDTGRIRFPSSGLRRTSLHPVRDYKAFQLTKIFTLNSSISNLTRKAVTR